jgi:triosephosphate isomerase
MIVHGIQPDSGQGNNIRTPVIAGNWKMNTTPADGKALAAAVAKGAAAHKGVEVIICPPFTGIAAAAEAVRGSSVKVGAQNAHAKAFGAFTGEVSVPMLKGLVTHVIVGHSERRAMFGETDATVAEKAKAVSAGGMSPIVCVGESLDVRKSGKAVQTVRAQVRGSLAGYEAWGTLTVAYEPVWAIGTGEAASPEQAQEIAAAIRAELASVAGKSAAESIRILYGGSVNPQNIGPFVDRADIDGALVGGASLKAEDFVRIIELTARVAGGKAPSA